MRNVVLPDDANFIGGEECATQDKLVFVHNEGPMNLNRGKVWGAHLSVWNSCTSGNSKRYGDQYKTHNLNIFAGDDKIETKESGKVVGGGIFRSEGAWQDVLSREQEVLHRSRQLNVLYRGASASKNWRITDLEACLGRKMAYNLSTRSMNAKEKKRIDGLQRRLIRRWMRVEPIWPYKEKNPAYKSMKPRESTKDIIAKYKLRDWSLMVRKEKVKLANKAISSGPGCLPYDVLIGQDGSASWIKNLRLPQFPRWKRRHTWLDQVRKDAISTQPLNNQKF